MSARLIERASNIDWDWIGTPQSLGVTAGASAPEKLVREVLDVCREIIADLVEDGSTLQMGIGAIPDAVLTRLHHKRDLGIHTEMFSDGLVELIATGAVTNRRKRVSPGRIIASFVTGTQRLFDYVHDNPLVELHPCDRTNDTSLIRKNDHAVAINSALEVDLTGQVCADSIGPKFYSGVGGQLDFIYGASRSKGGVPIIAVDLNDGKLEDAQEELWLTYFRNIFNPARVKPDRMLAEMPKKYWKNLPEAVLIQPLAGRFVLVGTFAILPLAYFIRNVPLVTRAALASFRQLDPSLEEAAAERVPHIR